MIGMRTHIGITEALLKLRPGAEFVVRDDTYEGIEWRSINQSLPSKKEIDDTIIQLKQEEPFRVLREIRNWYLQNSDWTQGNDIRTLRGPEWCAAWDNYRQQLRDLTNTQSPYFENENDFHLSGVIWPEKPNNT